MRIVGFIWLEDIIEKLAQKHSVQQQEVREVFTNLPQFQFIEKGHRPGENVYAALGQTNSGRYLTVFFVYKKDRRALIL
ncbi:MAG: BrnT family toxin [bacterium]|nr:BrnT family toxin [bacterium]